MALPVNVIQGSYVYVVRIYVTNILHHYQLYGTDTRYFEQNITKLSVLKTLDYTGQYPGAGQHDKKFFNDKLKLI